MIKLIELKHCRNQDSYDWDYCYENLFPCSCSCNECEFLMNEPKGQKIINDYYGGKW